LRAEIRHCATCDLLLHCRNPLSIIIFSAIYPNYIAPWSDVIPLRFVNSAV